MKAKFLVNAIIIGFLLKMAFNLSMELLLSDLKIDIITYGLIGGAINLFLFVSVAGLLIKIFRYHNKKDFLNS
ncbi:hypothetical protein [Winogradskyella sp.]|uniref:hypothetical protein n=1 Tax=Winogradskyella sp. TaxID=1883156 RepID=UPI003F6A9C20